MERNPLRVLIAEDMPSDAELAVRELTKAGLEFEHIRVDTREDFLRALDEFQPDLIICDYSMPQFDGLTAIQLTLENAPLTPLIIYTGSLNEETAVQCMKSGATDYILKDRPARLGHAALRALQQAGERKQHILDQARLVESERKYREIVETAYEGVWVVDVEMRITFANSRICEMLGYPVEQFIGHAVTEFLPPDDHELQRQRFAERKEGKHDRFEQKLLRRNGETLTVYISTAPVFDAESVFCGAFAMITDLTDRLRTEELRIEVEKQTERSLRLASIGTLAAGISHEINQPLTVIKSEVDGYLLTRMLDYSFSPEEVREIFQTISEQVQRINAIIQHMRVMVREPHEAKRELVDVGDAIRSALFFLNQQCRNHRIELVYTPPIEPIRLMINPIALEQSMLNVLHNAIQALDTTQRKDKRIEIRVLRHPGNVIIEIRNNGPSIPLNDLPKVFDPFFTTKTRQQNMGLGLAIVSSFVQAISGAVVCENLQPEGVMMRFTFPAEENLE
jgi:PAS domain S-box-containing protein